MQPGRQVTYTDELLADGTVHRRYNDGRQEWRRRGQGRVVHWQDERGISGTDELLGNGIIKRQYTNGSAVYGRDVGYGRTVWGRGEYVTMNRTSFGGRVGAILGGVAAGALIGPAMFAPVALGAEEEEELRQMGGGGGSYGGTGTTADDVDDTGGGDAGGGGGGEDSFGGGDFDDGGADFGGDDFG